MLEKILSKTFWLIALPLFALACMYCYWQNISPLDSLVFWFSLMLCIPMLLLKAFELEEASYQNILAEFRAMTSSDFFEKEEEIMSAPPNRNMSIIKEAYKQVYKERYGRDI